MLNKKANPLLVKMESSIRAKVDPTQTKAFEKIVASGTKVMYSENMHKMLVSQLKSPGKPEVVAAEGVAKLLGILMNQSKGTMPMKAGIPASAVLMCEALDMLEQLGRIKVDKNNLATGMQALSSSLLQLMGVTPQKLSEVMAQAQQKKQASQPPAQPEQPAPQGAQPLIGAPS